MKHYLWSNNSALPRVDIRSVNGELEAVIHAPASEAPLELQTLPETLEGLPKALAAQGWEARTSAANGKPVLKVTGFAQEEQLLSYLEEHHLVSGAAAIQQDQTAKEESKDTMQHVRENSSRFSGIFYSIGNVLMFLSGWQRGSKDGKRDWAQMGTGMAFMAGDGLLALAGKKDDQNQFAGLMTDLKKELKEKGVRIPSGKAFDVEHLAKDGGVIDTLYQFLQRHINTIKCLAEVVGGALYFKAGINQQNPRKQAAGAIIVAGWAAALITREWKPEPGDAKNLENWMHNKPTRLAGISGLIHNFLSIIGALEERGKEQRGEAGGTPYWRTDLAAISSMLVANSLYAMSNKTTGGHIKDEALLDEVYTMSAQIVAAQPPQLRAEVIDMIARYLGESPEIQGTRQEIAAKIDAQINALVHNPWAKAMEGRAAAPQQVEVPVSRAVPPVEKPQPRMTPPPAAWMDKQAISKDMAAKGMSLN